MSIFGRTFHIVKRDNVSLKFGILVRALAIIFALLLSAVVIMLLTDKDPLKIYGAMINGAVGTPLRRWSLFQDISILLCISLAVTPAFKMRVWNCGAEGQVLMGGLCCTLVMVFLGGKVANPILWIIMILAAILGGVIWAVIPAFFKANWNTNETLFTLMMNYIAIQIISFFLKAHVKSGSGVLSPMADYGLPKVFGKDYLLNIIVVAILTVLLYIYLKKTKQGYEISVVGESENTARYIGINVKKVIMRTLVVSGALCGVAGLLLVGGTSHTISTETAGGRGFTAIMVSWLAKFNPLMMVLTTLLIVFLQKGAKQVSTSFRISESISDIITGIILFFIIGCEFFLQYKILVSKNEEETN